MRILSWNINGIRTLPQYHPWNTLKSGNAILDALQADIICFQEMKIQRAALPKHIAVPERYDSFFSFPVAKGGYSGVAVYTNTATVAPLKAEEGLVGVHQPKPPFTAEERVSPTYPQVHEIEFFHDENEEVPSNVAALDTEGRALVLDFGLFVLINLYCPAETSETRLPYKMNFHLMLEERVRKLIHEEGREVIVVGDINVTASPMDHCDGHLPSQQADFWGHPPRAWFKKWLAPSGPMVDVIRDCWPERKGMYTCWNTKISARDSNYGTRVDYILLTRGLLPWFKHGDIQAAIRGSDHCPVYVDLHDEIRLDSGEFVSLRDAMKFEDAKRSSPRISARFWPEFRQQLLSNFFTTKATGDIPMLPATSPDQETGRIVQTSQASAIDVPSSQSEHSESSMPGTPTDSQQVSEAASSSLKRTSSLSERTDEQPAGVSQNKKRKVGQTKISSFFAKPSRAASSSGKSAPQSFSTTDTDGDHTDITQQMRELSQIDEDHKLALSLSEPADVTKKPGPSSLHSKAAWGQLLAPLQPPKCKAHGEPCKEFKVNKPGPNKGKAFFICSRPVGPGYDKGRSERLREEVDMQYRCDYFKWASDVKKAALKERNLGSLDDASGSKAGEIEASDT